MKVLSLESFPLYGQGSLAPHKCKNTDCLPSAYPQQRLSDAMLEVLHCVTSLQWDWHTFSVKWGSNQLAHVVPMGRGVSAHNMRTYTCQVG